MTTRSAMGRRPINKWDEDDAFTSWKHWYCYLQRPGVKAGIKRRARRRERHEAKSEMAKLDGFWR